MLTLDDLELTQGTQAGEPEPREIWVTSREMRFQLSLR
jgi:hypothetical protein